MDPKEQWMQELATALGEVLKKFGQFFDVFDLSFIVSGALTLSAVLAWRIPADEATGGKNGWSFLAKTAFNEGELKLSHATLFFIFILASYLTGLISFAVGRNLRRHIVGRLHQGEGPRAAARNDKDFASIAEAHGLNADDVYKSYVKDNNNPNWRLYARMWAKLRETKELKESYALCRRYWVLAATYDGLALAALVWFAVIIQWYNTDFLKSRSAVIAFSVVLVLTALACWLESQRLGLFQIEELVASLSLLKPANRYWWVPSDDAEEDSEEADDAGNATKQPKPPPQEDLIKPSGS